MYRFINFCNAFSSYQHLAASEGHEDIVNFLVREGADVNAEGKKFKEPYITLKSALK